MCGICYQHAALYLVRLVPFDDDANEGEHIDLPDLTFVGPSGQTDGARALRAGIAVTAYREAWNGPAPLPPTEWDVDTDEPSPVPVIRYGEGWAFVEAVLNGPATAAHRSFAHILPPGARTVLDIGEPVS